MKSKSAKTAKSRLLLVLDQAHTSPMSYDDLLSWLSEHTDTMIPADNDPSIQFVRRLREVHENSIPDYLLKAIDPFSIRSGSRDGRVFVCFSYLRGGSVTLYPCPDEPTESDYNEMANYFSRIEYENFMFRQQQFIPY